MAETALSTAEEQEEPKRYREKIDTQLQRVRNNNDELTAFADELEKIAMSRNATK